MMNTKHLIWKMIKFIEKTKTLEQQQNNDKMNQP